MDTSKLLFGTLNPMGRAPCFAVPIFTRDGVLYIQILDRQGDIESFAEIQVPIAVIVQTDQRLERSIGSPGLFAFQVSPSDFSIGSRAEIRKVVKDRYDSFMERPFLRLEIADFLGDDHLRARAMSEASALIRKVYPSKHFRWTGAASLSASDLSQPMKGISDATSDPTVILYTEQRRHPEKKEEALELAIERIEKQFGKGSVMKLGEAPRMSPPGVISSGSLSLDLALGSGGIPRGRITEILGSVGTGKTTLALHVIAQAQKQGGVAAYIDADHVLDLAYSNHCGVNVDDMLISQPDTGEQALEIAEALVRSGAVDVIVIDSVAALVPQAEIEGEMGDAHVGLQARSMSQALRKLALAVGRTETAVIFINQSREHVGVTFGSPETTPGERALKFYSSVRIALKRLETVKHGGKVIGSRVGAKVVKNKVAPPFRSAEFDVMFDHGISREADLLRLGLEMRLVKKSGAFFSWGDTRLGHGKDSARQFLEENPGLAEEIEQQVRVAAVSTGGRLKAQLIEDEV